VLKIYSSLSQQKEIFKPIQEGKVGIYVCGMTVYDYCHIGHARVMVAFDVITRFLASQGYDVHYVRNITDIDDKIFVRAAENGESYTSLTNRFIEAMHEDERSLSVLSPKDEPRASGYIDQIIIMIQQLVDKGYAYASENGDVYYEINKFKTYGHLNNKKLDELIAGSRVEVGDYKKSPLDFTLWKAAKEGESCWDSPWGKGRPGWHIECSAMSTCCLGDTFDIHGGGPDLKFPHHENEIAQSEAATGQQYVHYWMHAGAVRVNKEKMSKSLGNFFTIRDVLKKYPAEVIRYFLVSSHYRSQIDYSERSLQEAKASLDRFYNTLRLLSIDEMQKVQASEFSKRFNMSMEDDFNTPEALAVLFDMVREINRIKDNDLAGAQLLGRELLSLGAILGLLQQNPDEFLKSESGDRESVLTPDKIEVLIVKRNQARVNKDWAESDRIRDELKASGIILDDSREGTTWRREL
jgi:cysteinyl-tRNA synthetase